MSLIFERIAPGAVHGALGLYHQIIAADGRVIDGLLVPMPGAPLRVAVETGGGVDQIMALGRQFEALAWQSGLVRRLTLEEIG